MTARGLESRSRATLAALAFPWALATACASLAGLSGGSDDAAVDASHPHVSRDAAADHAVDSTALDASQESASGDAASDHLGADAADGRSDARADVARDAGVDVPCSPIVVEASANVACASPEASTCRAIAPADGSVVWHPPHQMLGVCTPTLVEGLLGACFSAFASESACSAFLADAPALACERCVVSEMSESTYGAIILTPQFDVLNTGGCVALADPCNKACAVAAESNLLCELASCENDCFRDGGAFDAEINAYTACMAKADTCACVSDISVASACHNVLAVQPATAPCYGVASFEQGVQALASLFCISGSFDAGATD